MLARGEIGASDMAWTEGNVDWTPLASLIDLAPYRATSTTAVSVAIRSATGKRRWPIPVISIVGGLSLAGVALLFFLKHEPAPPPSTGTFVAVPESTMPADTRVNLNTATLDELDAVPGIGAKSAERIIDMRPDPLPGRFGKAARIQWR